MRSILIRHLFAVADIRNAAGVIDETRNTDEYIGPTRAELKLHEKMQKLFEDTV